MSSGLAPPQSLPQDVPLVAPPTEYETFIDHRLHQTRRRVKGVDIADGLVTLMIGVLGYLLVAALADHWLVVGGLGFRGRLLCWLGLVVAAGTYFAYHLLPPLLYRINPVFAAATIEKSQPSLRNSLINFLLLRGRREEVAVPVYQALEYRAAADLSKVRLEVAVDRTRLVRLGCVLAAVVVLLSLYLALSPKSLLHSVGRVLWPWSTIEAPTRVTIHDVQPGDKTKFHGESVAVSAEVAGLREGESPSLVYSTADGQSVDQTIPMTLPDGDYRYQCRLPPGNLGLQQDYQYYLKAGDCQTRRYQITVRIAPAIVVDRVSYDYPAYTGLADRTLERQGDLRAIEGTEVTIHATANAEIKPGTAQIDLGCTGRRTLQMTVEGRTATGHFTLRLSPDDPAQAEYESYQLRFADLQGHENLRPIRNHIDVIRDLPPEVQLVEPQHEEVQAPEDGRVAIKVRAEDPDFALRRVVVRAVRDDRSLAIAPLLERRPPEKAWPGEFQGTYSFQPARLGLKAGDHVQYWAEAEDNKEPAANRSATDKQWITVVGPEGQRQPKAKPDGAKGNPNAQTKGKEQAQPKERENAQPNADQQPQDQPPPDQQAEKPQPKPGQPEKPKTDQPDQQKQQPPDQQQADGKSGDEKQQGQKSGAGKQDGKQQGGNKQDGKQEGGKQQGDKQQSGNQQGKNPQGGDQQGGQQQTGQPSEKPDQRTDPDAAPGDAMQKILNDRQQQQQNQGSPDKSQSPGEKSGKQPGNQSQPGNQQQPGNQADNQTTGPKQPGMDKGGKDQAGPGKQGAENSPAGQAGDQNAGAESPSSSKAGPENSSGEKADGRGGAKKPSGDKKPAGEKPSGEKTPGEPAAGLEQGEKAPPQPKPGADVAGGEKSGNEAGGKPQQPAPGEPSAAEKKPGQPQPGQEEQPGAGKPSGDGGPSPLPQEGNRPQQKKPGQAGAAPGQKKGQEAQSPGISNKQSDSQGDTSGDRSGGGQQGGGQQANQPGVGGPGANTPANEGGSKAAEKGEGEVGDKAGDKAVSKRPTGSKAKVAAPGGGGETASGNPAGEKATAKPTGQDKSNAPGTPLKQPSQGGAPSGKPAQAPAAPGAGPVMPGGGPGNKPDAAASPAPADSPADEANLEYAHRQTALALEHLRDQLAKEKPQLLERLGWSKDDARRFIARWEEMQRAAVEKGAAGEVARKQLKDALKSLGLRPRGTELRRGGTTPEGPQNLRDSGRFPPPPDWDDQFRAYTRGVANGDRRAGGTP